MEKIKNLKLKDVLSKHFGLKGRLYKNDGSFTKDGSEAYTKFVGMLHDLSLHVSMHIDEHLGNEILKLVDIFDGYKWGNSE